MSTDVLDRLIQEVVSLRRRVDALETQEPRIYGARVYGTTHVAIPNDTNTTLSFNAVLFDLGGLFSAATPTRLTCKVAGPHVISAHIEWAGSNSGYRRVQLYLNGTTPVADQLLYAAGTAGIRMSIATIWKLNAGDYVEVRVRQNSGAALGVLANLHLSPGFAMVRVG